nr:uncharacterized protein LOC109154494 isoform X2 [Ipomoea trifida]
MTLIENDDDDASSFFDLFAENLASPGLAPTYAASPSPTPTRWLFNHGGLTWNPVTEMRTAENAAAAALREWEMSEEGESSVVNHPQRDGEEALFFTPNFLADIGGGMIMSTSPLRMNCFSPPSGDSIGNFDPYRLWNFADHSGAQELENRKGMTMRPTWKQQQPCNEEDDYPQFLVIAELTIVALDCTVQIKESGLQFVKPCLLSLECLCQNMVIELVNGEQIMRLNVNLKHAYLEVDFSSEKSNAICSSQALELESWGGMIMEWISVNHQRRYAFCSKMRPWRVILELLDVVVRQLLYLGENNYSFGISVSSSSSSSSVNTKLQSVLYFERTFLEMQHLNSLERQFLDHFERLVQTGVLELLSGEEIKLQYLQEGEVGSASEENHSVSILPPLLEAECRMMQLLGKRRRDILKVSSSTFKRARRDFGITRRSLEEVDSASEENHTAQCNAAGTGGMLLQQEDSSSEPHIPVPSATNEERNNVVELKSIDAKGGNSSSDKTDTISRWEKDHGITRQVLEQLFGKNRDDAAKTLKVSTSTFKRACRDFGINRWPNHKGKRPNNGSLNQKHVQAVKKHKGIQRCPALPPEEATTTTLQGNSAMSVKVTYEDNTIRFPLPSSSTMKYLEEQLETRLKICLENFSIMYQDEEADWISLTCDSDLKCGMNVLRSSDKTVVKMKIKPNFG